MHETKGIGEHMQESMHEIEQFVAQILLTGGLVVAAGAFLLAGFLTRHRRSLDLLRGFDADAELADLAREDDLKRAYEDACKLDMPDSVNGTIWANLCHACGERPRVGKQTSARDAYLCVDCQRIGIDLCKRCNDWSMLNEADECPDCAIVPKPNLLAGIYKGTWCKACQANDHSFHTDSGGRCTQDNQYNADCDCSIEPFVIPTVFAPDPVRCLVTGNMCGTDTWAEGHPCQCSTCQEYLRKADGPFNTLHERQARRLSKPPRYEETIRDAAKSQSRCPYCGGTKRCQGAQCIEVYPHTCHYCNGTGVRCICKAKPFPANRYCPIHGGEDRNA